MSQPLYLSRQEAELLTNLLMLTEGWPSEEIDRQLRKQWGMCSREVELEGRGKTLAEFRSEWVKQWLDL